MAREWVSGSGGTLEISGQSQLVENSLISKANILLSNNLGVLVEWAAENDSIYIYLTRFLAYKSQ